jgi:hypothetical protein
MTQNSNPVGNPIVTDLVNATISPAGIAVMSDDSTSETEFDRFESLTSKVVGLPKAELNRA